MLAPEEGALWSCQRKALGSIAGLPTLLVLSALGQARDYNILLCKHPSSASLDCGPPVQSPLAPSYSLYVQDGHQATNVAHTTGKMRAESRLVSWDEGTQGVNVMQVVAHHAREALKILLGMPTRGYTFSKQSH